MDTQELYTRLKENLFPSESSDEIFDSDLIVTCIWMEDIIERREPVNTIQFEQSDGTSATKIIIGLNNFGTREEDSDDWSNIELLNQTVIQKVIEDPEDIDQIIYVETSIKLLNSAVYKGGNGINSDQNEDNFGTAGMFFTGNVNSGKKLVTHDYVISCGHVIAPISDRGKVYYYAGRNSTTPNYIGNLVARFFDPTNERPQLVDCAIAQLNPIIKDKNTKGIETFGLEKTQLKPKSATKGDSVKKFGRSTRNREGKVETADAPIRIESSDGYLLHFKDQLCISSKNKGRPFAIEGDSGSIVFGSNDEQHGLLMAISTEVERIYSSKGKEYVEKNCTCLKHPKFFANNLKNVYQALGAKVNLVEIT